MDGFEKIVAQNLFLILFGEARAEKVRDINCGISQNPL